MWIGSKGRVSPLVIIRIEVSEVIVTPLIAGRAVSRHLDVSRDDSGRRAAQAAAGDADMVPARRQVQPPEPSDAGRAHPLELLGREPQVDRCRATVGWLRA